ncbi:MAG: Gfo/Idh/MocA family oxidoreductase [Ignavibacteriaceae bacterium]|nr:Gfo/Idh/MocA family oxidoreductase [Ignavibacteriaceae bacterium]
MKNNLLLVGSGPMAIEYSKVLKSLNIAFTVICRKESSATSFFEKTGINPLFGGVNNLDREKLSTFRCAIVATEVDNLAGVSKFLIENGIKNLLIEKPAALNVAEMLSLSELAAKYNSKGYVAYNRRFYSSIQIAKRIIDEDGGVLSAFFEFTERSHLIKDADKTTATKLNWLIANSSHVIDMFISLCGIPKTINCYKAGYLDWHKNSAIFTGAGITIKNIPFSYHANWISAGGWGLEIFTNKRKLVFKPLERLKQQVIGSSEIEDIEFDYSKDISFKPGLLKMVEAFVSNETQDLVRLDTQVENIKIYESILKGQSV